MQLISVTNLRRLSGDKRCRMQFCRGSFKTFRFFAWHTEMWSNTHLQGGPRFRAWAPTLMVWAPAQEVPRMRSSMPSFKICRFRKHRWRKFLLSRLGMSRMDSNITKTLGDFATRLAEVEQNFSTFSARLCKVETKAASASNISGFGRSWPSLEQVDGSTAAGSPWPGSSDDNRNTRRRLDTFSEP